MLLFDYERIINVLKDIKPIKIDPTPFKLDYEFTEYSDPQLIKNIRTFQEDLKYLKTPTNLNSAQLKPSLKPINEHQNITTPYENTIHFDKSPVNFNTIPHIPFLEEIVRNNRGNDYEEFESELKKRVETALELERKNQKANVEKMMDERFSEWEQNHKTKEMQENIKNKDAVLNEMYEKINIEEQKFQMLMKIRELDNENTALKTFMDMCPPIFNEYGRESDGDEIEGEEEVNQEEEKEKIIERIGKENEEKMRREKEFYELSMQSQEILNNWAKVDNNCELERNLRPELW